MINSPYQLHSYLYVYRYISFVMTGPQASGKGFELGECYENIEFSFGNIENIHEVRSCNNRSVTSGIIF